MARYDDLNTRTIGYLTFISAVLLVVTILLLQALCYNWIDWQEQNKLTKQSYKSSEEVLQAQKASLESYGKVQVEVPVEANPNDGGTASAAPAAQMKTEERVQIPIDRAKALLLEELKQNASSGQSASAANT